MYPGRPHWFASRLLSEMWHAALKFVRTGWRPLARRMLPGRTSLWMIPRACMCERADMSPFIVSRAWASEKNSFATALPRAPMEQRSRTRTQLAPLMPAVAKRPWSAATFGCPCTAASIATSWCMEFWSAKDKHGREQTSARTPFAPFLPAASGSMQNVAKTPPPTGLPANLSVSRRLRRTTPQAARLAIIPCTSATPASTRTSQMPPPSCTGAISSSCLSAAQGRTSEKANGTRTASPPVRRQGPMASCTMLSLCSSNLAARVASSWGHSPPGPATLGKSSLLTHRFPLRACTGCR
mmetsp:Transcript_53947/g.157450  ORF Transcript_53947/g.157450 Transcript_53947/m.157450 type:complete len:297 (+) Transcript_53947:434-1324(+)